MRLPGSSGTRQREDYTIPPPGHPPCAFTRIDNHVIGVDVVEAGGELRPGKAEDLFAAPGTFLHRAVLADSARGRFLVPVSREQTAAALDVVLNWPALLRQ